MISKLLNRGTAQAPIFRHMIAGLKHEIPRDKIVLIDEMEMLVRQKLDPQSTFFELFSKYGWHALLTLNFRIQAREVPSAIIPLEDVEEHVVRFVLDIPDHVSTDEIFKYAAAKYDEQTRANVACYMGPPEHDPFNQVTTEEAVRNWPLKAVNVEDYFKAFSDASLKSAFGYDVVDAYQSKALAAGEGETVTNFWIGVHNMTGYFDTHPKPKKLPYMRMNESRQDESPRQNPR